MVCRFYLSLPVDVKFKIRCRIPLFIAMEVSINVIPVIFYFIRTCKSFMPRGFLKEIFKIHFIATIKEFGIISK